MSKRLCIWVWCTIALVVFFGQGLVRNYLRTGSLSAYREGFDALVDLFEIFWSDPFRVTLACLVVVLMVVLAMASIVFLVLGLLRVVTYVCKKPDSPPSGV